MARRRAVALEIDPSATDAALAIQVTAGSLAAFEELYRRHAQAAWRVAQSVTGNAEDAADAVSEAFVKVLKAVASDRLHDADRFRSYLLTASRNAALDVHRRRSRVHPTDAAEVFDGPTSDRGPSDAVVDGADRDMVARAFRSLPERWRSVLWLTEVEGIPPREAAGMLGVSANGVAQLAVRARAGLRERFLQAHLRDGVGDVDDACRFTVERLGASVAGALSPRDLAKVDQHLAACASCRARREELEDLGSSLRRIVIPFPIGLAALSLGKWQAAAAAVGAGGAGAGAGGAGTSAWLVRAQRPLAVASVGLFAAGIVGVGVVGQSGTGLDDVRRRAIEGQAFSAPAVNFTPAAAVAAGGTPVGAPSSFGDGAGSGTGGGPSSSDELARGDGGNSGDGGADGDDGAGDGGGPSTGDPTVPPGTTTTLPPTGTTTTTTAPPPTTTTTALAQLNVYATTGSTTATVSAGGCTGISTGSTATGCTAPAPAGDDKLVVEGNAPVVGYIRQAI